MSDRITEATVARIAGNLLSGTALGSIHKQLQIEQAVQWARAIVAEVARTSQTQTGA